MNKYMLLNTYNNMSSEKIIRLAKKFETKYCITKLATEANKIQQDIKNNLPDLMNEMFNDKVGVNITLGYQTGVGTWFVGAKIEIKNLVWSTGVSPEMKAKYTQKFNDIIKLVNKTDMRYEGGPWTFYLPIE